MAAEQEYDMWHDCWLTVWDAREMTTTMRQPGALGGRKKLGMLVAGESLDGARMRAVPMPGISVRPSNWPASLAASVTR